MKKKILIVEDSGLLQTILRTALIKAGFSVFEADNGRLGLSAIKETSPDLVLLDVIMPVMNGMEMYDEMQRDDKGKNIPVIMLTSSESTEVQKWITDRGLESVKKDSGVMDELPTLINKRLGME